MYAKYKNDCQSFESLWKVLKIWELNEVIQQDEISSILI